MFEITAEEILGKHFRSNFLTEFQWKSVLNFLKKFLAFWKSFETRLKESVNKFQLSGDFVMHCWKIFYFGSCRNPCWKSKKNPRICERIAGKFLEESMRKLQEIFLEKLLGKSLEQLFKKYFEKCSCKNLCWENSCKNP